MTASTLPNDSATVCVVDISTLIFERGAGRIVVRLSTGEGLRVVPVDLHADERELAAQACDETLRHARIWRLSDAGRGCEAAVALYNPLSAQVVVGAIPDCVIFQADEPLELDPSGTLGVIVDDHLVIGTQTLAPSVPDRATLRRAGSCYRPQAA